MVYEISVRSKTAISSEFDLFHDNPHSVKNAVKELRLQYPDIQLVILKDDIETDLKKELKSYEIQELRQEECELPSVHQKGWELKSDITEGADGTRRSVRKPPNPEDDYA